MSRSGGGDNVEGDVMVARKGHQSEVFTVAKALGSIRVRPASKIY